MYKIYNDIIPFQGFKALTLYPLLFIRSRFRNSMFEVDFNHEEIHGCQQREMLWIFFFIWYLMEWLIKWIIYRDSKIAYRNISFEREAYYNEGNLAYCRIRKFYSWIMYL